MDKLLKDKNSKYLKNKNYIGEKPQL